MRTSLAAILILVSSWCCATEEFPVRGMTKCGNEAIPSVELKFLGANNIELESASDGSFELRMIAGEYTIFAFAEGYKFHTEVIQVRSAVDLVIEMSALEETLSEVTVTIKHLASDMDFLRPVEGTAIYNGMKSEVISPERSMANTATNNSRQIFAKVAGLNVWENDGAGIQLGIGTRGLSPDRTSNFNVRQNLYDISADALGYPESYYTPPLEAVEKIEIVRGAASLQYGTQFGGLLNFKLKQGPEDQKIAVVARQTIGTFGIADTLNPALTNRSTFVSVGGGIGKVRYYFFANLKDGQGWRRNSEYNVKTGHANAQWDVSEKLELSAELTTMSYLAKQSGGLVDSQFEQDPRQSNRDRNWFKVEWNLASFNVNYHLNTFTDISSKTFGLLASRQALGHLGDAGRVDPGGLRDLIYGRFRNAGNETRILHRISHGEKISVLSAGVRVYSGYSQAKQGLGQDGNGPSFGFADEQMPFFSDYAFPNFNVALFTQEVIALGNNISITPGLRFEYINTQSEGQVSESIVNGAGGIVETMTFSDERGRDRQFLLGGIGASWKSSEKLELYSNFSQNYRAINFTDIQLRNMGLMIDTGIQDERGFNADIGVRGTKGIFRFDASVFMLKYNDRIGAYYTSIPDPILVQKPVRYRTNIADSRNLGLEGLLETEFAQVIENERLTSLKVFANTSWIDAKYTSSTVTAFDGNRVELVPIWTLRSGASVMFGAFNFAGQFSFIGEQFSDATNAIKTANGIDGIIPAYSVIDVSSAFQKNWLKLELNVNNATNVKYFTRRAAGYPGPGILPSDGRAVYLTAQVKF